MAQLTEQWSYFAEVRGSILTQANIHLLNDKLVV